MFNDMILTLMVFF